MPTVFRKGPYRFAFFAEDGKEPRHIHAKRDNRKAKFWLDPHPHLARNYGFSPAELAKLSAIVQEYALVFSNRWNAFFTDRS